MTDHPAGDPAVSPPSDSPARRGDLIALIGTTTRVYDECLLPNGALVSAPAHLPFYPARATDAFLCRPGPTIAAAILAMDALGRDVRTPPLRWLRDRAAGFGDDGLLRRAYQIHGPVRDDRPDLIGSGILLAAIVRRSDRAQGEIATAVCRALASAIAVRWDGQRFRDHPDAVGAIRAAELTVAASGLRAAAVVFDVPQWSRVADTMTAARDGAIVDAFAFRGTPDPNAEDRDDDLLALLALAWPLGSADAPPDAAGAADLAEAAVGLRDVSWHGGDPVAHLAHAGTNRLRPADLFWLAAAHASAGNVDRAGRYHALGTALADGDGHFPAHVAAPDRDPAPRPFLLAHLLFVLSAGALGLLDDPPRTG
ncbi:MAG: hypothetical protein AVDCRST_MAG73-1415 [uncultured Thermomicrobiales bacterium]|uniref:GH15-like domain-containing protein n=1 Tax=uncultured Thermomicrobiales bacterium TaxID=1645740 RepID=A0A6J4TZT4_9BACT|nr:MAG: hypothetical protein AVDCRST_MAG73-1415 [uncultured Thermomicrobiales bacterium]